MAEKERQQQYGEGGRAVTNHAISGSWSSGDEHTRARLCQMSIEHWIRSYLSYAWDIFLCAWCARSEK